MITRICLAAALILALEGAEVRGAPRKAAYRIVRPAHAV